MKRLTVFLLVTFVILCIVQVGAALTYEGTLEATPPNVNALKPGDEVSITGTIIVPASGDYTFNQNDNLEFYTQLTKPTWTYTILLDQNPNPRPSSGGPRLTIVGNDISYLSSRVSEVKITFSLTGGTVPSSFTSGNIILFRGLELDSRSEQVGAGVYKNGTVISTEALKTQLDSAKAKLATLKADIDTKGAAGVDVTVAQQKYDTANTALEDAARDLDASPTLVQPLLDTATNNINDASSSLDKAWADQSILQAKAQLASVDGLINEFTVNDSLKTTDSRLAVIINKRDLAAQAISNANDLFTTGTYPSARGKAGEGLTLANQAWNLSLDLKTELGKGFSLPGLPNLSAFLPVIIVILIVAAIAGVIIYRKKTQWDELG